MGPVHAGEAAPGPDQHPSFRENGGTKDGIERWWRQEWHHFFTNTRRWRDLRKITVASVQGPVYSAGLMLMWACDLIVADETAVFADVVGTRLGMCGVEYFAHPWELGPRRAKELLLTGDSLSVDEAHRLGMVSKVFPPGRLEEDTLAFARRIAELPTAAALMIKEAVNQTQDNQGFYNSLQAAFTLHELNHAHWAVLSQGARLVQTAELGGPGWQHARPVRPVDPSRP
jgi:enoyl-CoA hydratase